jgi:hypothetical protein
MPTISIVGSANQIKGGETMAKEIAALLADVQRLMREVSEMNANDNANQVKEESQPEASETSAPEPAPSPASDLATASPKVSSSAVR